MLYGTLRSRFPFQARYIESNRKDMEALRDLCFFAPLRLNPRSFHYNRGYAQPLSLCGAWPGKILFALWLMRTPIRNS